MLTHALTTSYVSNHHEALSLHIQRTRNHGVVLNALQEENAIGSRECPISLQEVEALADLCIRESDGDVEYLLRYALIKGSGLHRLYQTTKAEAPFIRPVLHAADHFFRYLRQSRTRRNLHGNIDIEAFELRRSAGELDLHLRAPFQTYGRNIIRSSTIDVVADDKTPYGICIRNSLGVPLHVWVFYFDCSDLSIC